MSNTLQGTIPNTKFKKDYKILGRKSSNQIGLKSKILFIVAILALGFSSVIFVINYNNFLNSNNNSHENQSLFTLQSNILSSSIVEEHSPFQSSVSSQNFTTSVSGNGDSQVTTSSQSKTIIQSSQNSKNEEPKQENLSSQVIIEAPKITLRVLSGADFQQIYENTQYQNVSDSINPTVTDVVEVDNYIKALAEKRGYKLRPQALEHYLQATDGFLLQQPASEGWNTLKQAAAKSGINLVLTSGYRSIASQKTIFAADLAPEYQVADILSGKVDGALDKVMARASVPGYSRHHTGYTIDVGCSGESTTFRNTSCYQWMKKDNFAQARLAGYIPSYPEGASLQGPNPEEWEFVWVGDSR
jgi:LAS superfamily LD-carboxypeptidase LdcB